MLLAAIRTSKSGRLLDGTIKFFSADLLRILIYYGFSVCFLKKERICRVELSFKFNIYFYLEIQFLFC